MIQTVCILKQMKNRIEVEFETTVSKEKGGTDECKTRKRAEFKTK